MGGMTKPKVKDANYVSKKPKKKGVNSGASLEMRTNLILKLGMVARSCDSTYKMIQAAFTNGAKYEGEVTRFPAGIEVPFDEKTREIKCNDLGELRKLDRALEKHDKDLTTIWKSVRTPRKPRPTGNTPKTYIAYHSDEANPNKKPSDKQKREKDYNKFKKALK